MIKTTITAFSLATLTIFSAANNFNQEIPVAVEFKEVEDVQISRTRQALRLVNCPPEKLEKLTRACYAAGFATNIDPLLIATIIPRESEFNIKARSSAGYKSLMQTKQAFTTWDFAEANVMAGACELRRKINATKGNIDKAMVYYKGHGGAESHKIAKEQMKFYRSIKTTVLQMEKESNRG